MDEWIAWVIAAVVFAAGEIANMSFYLLPFANGAGAAAIVSLAGGSTALSVVTFVILTAISFGVVRPIARRHIRMPPQLRTGTSALVGKQAIVLERIANDENAGAIRLEGEIWTARAYDDDEIIEAGRRVQVIEIRGATALVAD